MAKQNQDTRNPEPNEVVGSKDLRESFKEGNIRGSWYLNGIELHQFDAASPASVTSQINAKTGAHFVTAEIDDGGHLVLIDYSGADIQIAPGNAYVEAPAQSTGDAAKDAVTALKNAAKEDGKKKDEGNKVLDQLGLKDTSTKGAAAPGRAGFEVGRSAEDRRKAAEYAKAHPEMASANPNQPATSPGIDKSFAPQIASNPTPGATSGAGGKLDDGRGRTGTGGGQGETSAKTVQDQHSGKGTRPAPVPGA